MRLPARPVAAGASPYRMLLTGPSMRFLLLAAIWGMSFLFIKVGDGSFAPLQVALVRTALGAATLLGVMALRRERLPRGWRIWGHLSVACIVQNVLPFTFFAYGETHVTSILAGIWNATAPLFTTVITVVLFRLERPTPMRILGVGLGFVGVLVVLGGSGLRGGTLLGNLLCMGAAVCYGFGYPYTRRFLTGQDVSVVALSGAQLLCATVVLAVITPIVSTAPQAISGGAVASLAALGILGTGVAYVLSYSLVREVGATAASTVTYVIPLFSTVVGIVALSEPLTINEPIGGAVVVAGVVIAQRWGRTA